MERRRPRATIALKAMATRSTFRPRNHLTLPPLSSCRVMVDIGVPWEVREDIQVCDVGETAGGSGGAFCLRAVRGKGTIVVRSEAGPVASVVFAWPCTGWMR